MRTFGTADKPVLIAGILVVLALVATAAGVLAMRRLSSGLTVIALFGAVGVATALTAPAPTGVVLDGRDAMIAVAMNGDPLPPEHGFPARMFVPGLYGYASATKWVTELGLTTFGAYDPYWIRRGWSDRAPVKTASRIDTPDPLASLAPGRVPVAGVAWAQHRGICRVQVRIDGGDLRPAKLSAPVNANVWRQWVYEWDATPGRHRIEVRATDGAGAIQPERQTPPFPDGATGWHAIVVTVAE